jgi:predicted RNA binding protein YcfA (HicA-like mRNA interferase family)
MPKVPRIRGADAVRAFTKAGYDVSRVRGSHYIMRHPGRPERLSIPVHEGEDLGAGLLLKQIKLAGLTVEEFCNLL